MEIMELAADVPPRFAAFTRPISPTLLPSEKIVEFKRARIARRTAFARIARR